MKLIIIIEKNYCQIDFVKYTKYRFKCKIDSRE